MKSRERGKLMPRVIFFIGFLTLSACNIEKPHYIDYKHFSDDKSIDYKHLMQKQIEEDKKKEQKQKNKSKKEFFQKYYVD